MPFKPPLLLGFKRILACGWKIASNLFIDKHLSYNGGERDAFVAKVQTDGKGLAYCGYIGGAAQPVRIVAKRPASTRRNGREGLVLIYK